MIQVQLIGTFKCHDDAITAVVTVHSWYTSVSGALDGTLKVWDLYTGNVEHELVGHRGPARTLVAFPDGYFIISGGDDGKLMLWNAETGEQIRVLGGHDAPVTTMALLPDGKRLVSGGADGKLMLWDTLNGEELMSSDLPAGVPDCLITSSDGRYVYCAVGGIIRTWDLETLTPLPDYDKSHPGVRSLVLTTQDRQLVSGAPGSLNVWRVDDGTSPLQSETLPRNALLKSALHDRYYLLLSTDKPGLVVRNLLTGEALSLPEPSDQVMAVTVTDGNRYIIAGCADGHLHIYKVML